MKTTLKPLLAALCLTAFACTVSAQTIKAADVHPEGYPNVVAVQHMVKNSNNKPMASWRLRSSPAACWGMKSR